MADSRKKSAQRPPSQRGRPVAEIDRPASAPAKVPMQRVPARQSRPATARSTTSPPRPPMTPPTWTRRPALVVVVCVGVGLLAATAATLGVRAIISEDNTALPRPESVPFAAPPALKSNGTYVQTRVLASGDLRVTQWIRSTALIFQVTLSTPDVAGLPSRALHASGVRVAADGQLVSGRKNVRSSSVKFNFLGAKAVKVSYVLHGALASGGSDPGRTLARVTSLDVDYQGRAGPATRVIKGAHVLSLACTAPKPGALPRPCGSPDGNGWKVTLPYESRTDRVMAQLDLSGQ